MSDAETPGADRLLVVGRIIRPHGLRGAVIVKAVSDDPERFSVGESLLVERGPGLFGELTVGSVSRAGGRLVIHFAEVEGIDEAGSLRGRDLLIPEERAVAPGDGEYWIHELIGMSAEDEDGLGLGEVTDFVSGTAQDLLVLRDGAGAEFRVPFVEEFVRRVDTGSRTITLRLIRGLGPGS